MKKAEMLAPLAGVDPDVYGVTTKNKEITVAWAKELYFRDKKAGLTRPGLSVHKLRHTCLTMLLHQGVDLMTLKLLAGQEDISTTAIYLHVNQEQLRSAIEKHPLG